MKNRFKILYTLLGLTLLFSACTPDKYELGPMLSKSDLLFTVTQDASNPNIFVLNSETPNAQPYWVTPVGTSTRLTDTIDIPFPGKDTIYYSVESPGGIVTADPYVFDVTTIDAAYVSDSMWTYLTGGIGKSKTWVLDLDANGVSKYFLGPVYFGSPSGEWDPAWSDIPWANIPAGDYGTMTFDLIGNAHLTTDNKMFPALSGAGKFMLYPGTGELITYGAQVLHGHGQGDRIYNWFAKMKIKSVGRDHLQIIAYMNSAHDEWLIYNYITKDYYDSH